jgi:hypothetical protein
MCLFKGLKSMTKQLDVLQCLLRNQKKTTPCFGPLLEMHDCADFLKLLPGIYMFSLAPALELIYPKRTRRGQDEFR